MRTTGPNGAIPRSLLVDMEAPIGGLMRFSARVTVAVLAALWSLAVVTQARAEQAMQDSTVVAASDHGQLSIWVAVLGAAGLVLFGVRRLVRSHGE